MFEDPSLARDTPTPLSAEEDVIVWDFSRGYECEKDSRQKIPLKTSRNHAQAEHLELGSTISSQY